MSASQKKELMEGYLGIKFRTIRGEGDYPPGFAELFPEFKECAGICNKYDMVPQNAGNFSVRIAGGMAITATGSNLALLEKDDMPGQHAHYEQEQDRSTVVDCRCQVDRQ